jgi:hypothetical protein
MLSKKRRSFIEGIMTVQLFAAKPLDHAQRSCQTAAAKRRSRRFSPYESNRTAARQARYSHQHERGQSFFEHLELIDRIHDHAYRRIQLFYYLLLVYWKEGVRVEMKPTVLQHGSSRCLQCSAAHSSLLPNVVDSKGVFPEVCYLRDSLNATVEMPDYVNYYDGVIEKAMRPKALNLLNQVSLNGLHPYVALQTFINQMHQFFEKSREMTRKKISLANRIFEILKNFEDSTGQKDHTVQNELKLLKKKYRGCKGYALSATIKTYTSEKIAMAVSSLYRSLTVLETQSEATSLPDYQALSGRVIENLRVPLTDQELFLQKWEIIKTSKGEERQKAPYLILQKQAQNQTYKQIARHSVQLLLGVFDF